MAEFSLRPKAIADLEEIWDYTVETWGEEQAERYVRLINDSFRQPADNPSIGPFMRCDPRRLLQAGCWSPYDLLSYRRWRRRGGAHSP